MVPDYVLTDHMLKSVEHCLELHKIRNFTRMLSHSMFVISYHQVRSFELSPISFRSHGWTSSASPLIN